MNFCAIQIRPPLPKRVVRSSGWWMVLLTHSRKKQHETYRRARMESFPPAPSCSKCNAYGKNSTLPVVGGALPNHPFVLPCLSPTATCAPWSVSPRAGAFSAQALVKISRRETRKGPTLGPPEELRGEDLGEIGPGRRRDAGDSSWGRCMVHPKGVASLCAHSRHS